VDSEGISEELSDKVSNIEAEVQLLEEEYKKDLLYHDKVCSPQALHYIYLHNTISMELPTYFQFSVRETTLMKNCGCELRDI
jgi:hypothetical protein